MQIFKTLLITLTFFCAVSVQAQKEVVLSRFNVSEYKGQVFLTWQIAAGSTCSGINIFRSTDGIEFTEINKIYGVCGSFSEPVNYDFTDGNPHKNQKNYYQLELGDGFFSPIISIEIVDVSTGYLLKPNPVSDVVTIYFSNENNEMKTLKIVDLNGKEHISVSDRVKVFSVNVSSLPNGMYGFNILNSENSPATSGKLIVQH